MVAVHCMFIFSKQGILKACSVVLGLIVVSVGCDAVLEAELYSTWNRWEEVCRSNPKCPTNWRIYEDFFMGATLAFWIISVINFISGFFFKSSSSTMVKVLDVVFQCIAGIFVLIAGILLLVAARNLDSYLYEFIHLDYSIQGIPITLGVSCKSYNYGNKLFAGFLSIMNAFLHFLTAFVIGKAENEEMEDVEE